MTFEQGLSKAIANLPVFSIRRRVVQRILNLPVGDPRREKGLLIIEGNAAAALNLPDDKEIDWTEGAANGAGTINWAQILQLLMTLLPLLLTLFGL